MNAFTRFIIRCRWAVIALSLLITVGAGTLATGQRTVMVFDGFKANSGVSTNLFSPQALSED